MRLRDPIKPGRTRRIGAAAAASLLLHGAIVAVLMGAALSIAVEAAQPRAVGEIQMSMPAEASPDLLRSAPQAPIRSLDPLLTSRGEGGASAPRAEPEPTGDGDLSRVLERADSAARDQGAATTSASGAAAALEHTPAGAGVAFAGLSARGEQARAVVYVIDASGPMISSLSDVFAEVNRSVANLLPTQRFGVVLFRDTGEGRGTLEFDTQLREASPRNRDQLRRWLAGVTAGGRSNPMQGLRAGLAFRPQVVFLLSRSITRTGGNVWDTGPDAILAELDRVNPALPGGDGRGRATLIKTIQFQEPDSTGVMQKIAERHGGAGRSADGPAYRVLKREELQAR